MIFNTLYESSLKGELILIDGGMCRYHLCKTPSKKGQITIHEIIVQQEKMNQGIGTLILNQLKQIPEMTSIFAKCPVDYESNKWYESRGFVLEGTEYTKGGKQINLWRLQN